MMLFPYIKEPATGSRIPSISTGEIKISVVVSRENAEEAVKALHDAFDLG
jgi:aspartokinase